MKASAFHKQSEAIPNERRMILEPLMKQIRELTAYIRGYDKTIEERVASYPEAAPLMKIAGVGPQVTLAFICTIEDPDRFRGVRKVGSYLGLRPRMDESGQIRKELGITKAGDRDVRRLLVSSAQYILGPLGPDTDLRRWGLKLAERGGQGARKTITRLEHGDCAKAAFECGAEGVTREPRNPGIGRRTFLGSWVPASFCSNDEAGDLRSSAS
jgi:transposase